MADGGKSGEVRRLLPAELAGGGAAGVLWLRARSAPSLATRINIALGGLGVLPGNAAVCAKEGFINQLTQKQRALSPGCAGRYDGGSSKRPLAYQKGALDHQIHAADALSESLTRP